MKLLLPTYLIWLWGVNLIVITAQTRFINIEYEEVLIIYVYQWSSLNSKWKTTSRRYLAWSTSVST